MDEPTGTRESTCTCAVRLSPTAGAYLPYIGALAAGRSPTFVLFGSPLPGMWYINPLNTFSL